MISPMQDIPELEDLLQEEMEDSPTGIVRGSPNSNLELFKKFSNWIINRC